MLSTKTFSQQRIVIKNLDSIISSMGKIYPINFNEVTYYQNYFKNISIKNPERLSLNSHISKEFILNPVSIEKGFYCNNLGFFCKKEIQLEKITSVSLRFRLGSLEYVNWLEGKR